MVWGLASRRGVSVCYGWLDVYAVQLFSRCPNAQKWVWMFMLYSCSASIQMLKNGCGCLCCTVDEWMSAALLRAQASKLSRDSLNTDAKKWQWLEVYMYKTVASLKLPNACQSQVCQLVEANDWNSTSLFFWKWIWMFMLYSCSAGVQMLKNGCGCLCCMVVQHVMMYPNAQKWVWMFMLSSCSAGSQMLRSGCGCLCCTVVQQVAKCSDR